ncbi:TonB-dependent receptor [Niabella sp.]|uniref:TonB-dependent receptor n=1 Tax=Niabella sp. TaxID=1962976 RepID=UPI00261B6EB6|nr:TonB-dependent receptor [Niabella sp.]
MLKKIYLFMAVALLSTAFLHAQVTTSSITGSVKTEDNKALEGATVTAVHEPSGTKYQAVSNKNGLFNLQGLRIGGPYTVEVSFVGYSSQKFEQISLALGVPYDLQVALSTAATDLQAIVVSATSRKISTVKQGPTTVFGQRELTSMPTISRSLTDITRGTPQANGNNFGGRDGRMNNLKVDGVNMNNNFGLSNDPQPGGGLPPISIDAFDQVSVATAPFDVRQSGFTGAAINAVTKSGTNTFHGTAYTFFTSQDFNGSQVRDYRLTNAKTKNNIYGGSFGGPIIKNKLFFFANGEYEKSSRPGPTWYPTGGSGTGQQSNTPVNDMKLVADHVLEKYGYDVGAYQSTPPFAGDDWRVLGKIDWNIDLNNKLTLKYTNFNNTNDWATVNNGSIPNSGGFSVVGRTGSVTSLPNNRYSKSSMAFFNSNYYFKHLVTTYSAELNSKLSSSINNQFLFTVTKNKDTRISPAGTFPTVDIFNGAGQNYISLGTDPFTANNDVVNNITSVIDNFTYNVGKHTLTAGVSYEQQYLGNMFMPGAASYYAYDSLGAFLNDLTPAYYSWTYSLLPGNPNPYSAKLKTGQWGVYVQDDIKLTDYFTISAGLRVDKINYLENPIGNYKIDSMFFPNAAGDFVRYSTSKWPNSRPLVSPRASFRWDVLHDRSLILRGGSGLFTGRFPLVWLTNMPSNAGIVQFGGKITDRATLSTIKFNPDPSAYADKFTPAPNQTLDPSSVTIPGTFALIDKNFKFPMVWTSDLAVDKTFGKGFTATLEATVTKDVYALNVRNANFKPADSVFYEGDLTRARYTSASKFYNGNYNAYVIENSNKGYSATFTAQLTKAAAKGFFGSVAYVYTVSKSINGLGSAQANSLYNFNPNQGVGNDVELANSQYVVPHRVVANLSYKIEYANHLASTIGLYYSGSQSNGINTSYIVNGDINNDARNAADLMYIPKNQAEMNFQTLTVNGTGADGKPVSYTFTPGQQKEAFETFINNSNYLKKHRGEIAGRNAALLPWYNKLDLAFLQDFYVRSGKTRHNLQFSVNVLNFLNMLNRNWGVLKTITINNPLVYKSLDANARPVYTWSTYSVNRDGGATGTQVPTLYTQPYQDLRTAASTWQMQLGLRYTF